MKALLILLPCLLAIALADPDYADLTTGDFGPTGTCRTAPANFVESPIAITDQTCTTYDSFAISLANPTTTATPAAINTATGAFTQTYNGASLTYNNITYTSTQFTFRTQSEHSIPTRFGGQSSAEIQIEMTGNGQTAILAFLVRAFDFSNAANDAYKNAKYNQILNSFDSSAANGWNVGFSTLSGLINDNLGNTAFLNIYTYNGTKTYGDCGAAIWFVYGQEIYADATVINTLAAKTKTALGADAGTGNNVNNRPMNVVGGGAGTATTIRLCYTGFFEVVLGYNYGLWFGVTSILLFFIFTLTLGDTPIRDRDYQEDVWTHHPLVSVYKYGNEMHTRKSRVALILAMITVHALFSSVFYRETAPADRTKGSNIILFAVYSMLIDWVISYFLGRILRTYYLAKYQLHKTKDEAWDQKAQNRLFGYYIAIFIVVIVGWAFTVWNMGELHPETVQEPSRFWVASLFIGLALELVVVTPIVCAIAGSVDAVRNWIKSQGFMYDNICHETYMEYLKSD